MRLFKQVRRQTHFALRAKFTGIQSGRAFGTWNRRWRSQLVFGAYIAQCTVQRAVKEVVHHASITEAHFVLGRVNVDVDHRRVNLKKQHKRWVPTVEQHIAIRLTHCVGYQLVAHRSPVDIEILQVGLTARERR